MVADVSGSNRAEPASAEPRLIADVIEDQIAAIEKLGQHGRMPDYWREPLLVALATLWVRIERTEAA